MRPALIVKKELSKIVLATQHGKKAELEVHAGHGLTYNNVQPIASIAGIDELNIGHSIVSRSIFCGLQKRRSRNERHLATLLVLANRINPLQAENQRLQSRLLIAFY